MSELTDFYERYMEVFNERDHAAFAAFFHLPVTVVHTPRYDERRAGRTLATVNDTSAWAAPLPAHWERSTIDTLVPIEQVAGFVPREGLEQVDSFRAGLFATVTRWHIDGEPYEHLHVLYLLTREAERLGIKAIVELAAAHRPEDLARG